MSVRLLESLLLLEQLNNSQAGLPSHVALDSRKVTLLAGLNCLSSSKTVLLQSLLLTEWASKLPPTMPVDITLLEVRTYELNVFACEDRI